MAEQQERERFNDLPIYTLSEIGRSLKSVIAKNYPSHYYVKAEIIKLNLYPKTGHCYPELAEKENGRVKAQMRAVIWATQFRQIEEKFRKITGETLKEGLSILALVTIEYHEQYGLALYIQDIEPSFTLGEMAKNRAETIERLKREGLFVANKGRVLPLVPKRVAVISVETSKGYSDFMITLQQNNWNYCFETELFPAVLQGEKAIVTITEQLANIALRVDDFDCVVIVRGGGGDVGLSCYDDYRLAAAVASFPLPVVSGIGHSTNITVTEMVSFESKITPTEVAYFLIQKFHDFAIRVEEFHDYIVNAAVEMLNRDKPLLNQASQLLQAYAQNIMARHKVAQENLSKSIHAYSRNIIAGHKTLQAGLGKELRLHASRLFEGERVQVGFLQKQLFALGNQEIKRKNDDIALLAKQVELLHPDNVLKRGFSITYLDGKAVTDAAKLQKGQKMVTQFYSGEVESEVL